MFSMIRCDNNDNSTENNNYSRKNSDNAKLCMSPSLGGTLLEYVISQEDNSPLTLYIDFYHSFLNS